MLKLNVGASRKVGDNNYGSRGASINLELELDSTLIADPARLQEKMRQLFALVRTSLAEEINGNHDQRSNDNGATGPTREQSNERASRSPRPATQSQVKAIYGICKAQNVNLPQLLRERAGVARPEELSLEQASELIGELKDATGREAA